MDSQTKQSIHGFAKRKPDQTNFSFSFVDGFPLNERFFFSSLLPLNKCLTFFFFLDQCSDDRILIQPKKKNSKNHFRWIFFSLLILSVESFDEDWDDKKTKTVQIFNCFCQCQCYLSCLFAILGEWERKREKNGNSHNQDYA